MSRYQTIALIALLLWSSHLGLAQTNDTSLRTFGYFQNQFFHQSAAGEEDPALNSFSMQQLNLFLRKDLTQNWRAWVNFEIINTFSSGRRWGAFNLEEAWARYRASPKFSLKVGLLIPAFNHLNEIKNRTPLLPYIIRPIVYETSFKEFIAVEEFAPARAFIQATGFLPIQEVKFDYAVYLGNSPNISSQPPDSLLSTLTGVDTTNTFLIGGRIGLRYEELKLGFSWTRDNSNIVDGIENFLGGKEGRFREIIRYRFGLDLSYYFGPLSFWGEFISVNYLENDPGIALDKRFYYGTLGYQFTDKFFIYGGYWDTFQDFTTGRFEENELVIYTGDSDLDIWTVGASYGILETLALKAQFGYIDGDVDVPAGNYQEFENFQHWSAAISIMF